VANSLLYGSFALRREFVLPVADALDEASLPGSDVLAVHLSLPFACDLESKVAKRGTRRLFVGGIRLLACFCERPDYRGSRHRPLRVSERVGLDIAVEGKPVHGAIDHWSAPLN